MVVKDLYRNLLVTSISCQFHVWAFPEIILFVSVRKHFNIIMMGDVLLICSMYYNTKFMAVTMVTIVPLYVSKCIVMNDILE